MRDQGAPREPYFKKSHACAVAVGSVQRMRSRHDKSDTGLNRYLREIGQIRDLHLWQIDVADAGWDRVSDVLSLDEWETADRFRTHKLRLYYRRCRSALRVLLSRYSPQNAADIQFHYGEFGKPDMADRKLHFNLSHSENLGLVAISLHPVGIDLEFVNPLRIDMGLVNILCHPVEKTSFLRLPPNERYALFYQLWTKKEAYRKALGVGLQRSLCALRLEDLSPTVSQVYDEHPANDSSFFVYNIPSVFGYAASVCLPHSGARISLFKIEPRKLMNPWSKASLFTCLILLSGLFALTSGLSSQ